MFRDFDASILATMGRSCNLNQNERRVRNTEFSMNVQEIYKVRYARYAFYEKSFERQKKFDF